MYTQNIFIFFKIVQCGNLFQLIDYILKLDELLNRNLGILMNFSRLSISPTQNPRFYLAIDPDYGIFP